MIFERSLMLLLVDILVKYVLQHSGVARRGDVDSGAANCFLQGKLKFQKFLDYMCYYAPYLLTVHDKYVTLARYKISSEFFTRLLRVVGRYENEIWKKARYSHTR